MTLTPLLCYETIATSHLITMLHKQIAVMPPRESVGVCDFNGITLL